MSELSNLNSLRYFTTVARTQHFTEAARKLYVSQSTLSKSIEALEQEIGVPLFVRTGRNVKLTRYGHILQDYVNKGLKEVDEGVSVIRELAHSVSGTISIGSIFTVGAVFVPHILARFREAHPSVTIDFCQTTTREILSLLQKEALDLGFAGEFDKAAYPTFSAEKILTEPLILIVPENHPFARAGRTSVDFMELTEEEWIGYNQDTGIYLSIQNTLDKIGAEKEHPLRYSFMASEDSTIVGMVRAGLGIGIIADIPSINRNGVVPLRIDHPYFYRNLYMIWNNASFLPEAARAFRNEALHYSHSM